MTVTIKVKDPTNCRVGSVVVQGSNTGKVKQQLGTPITHLSVAGCVTELLVEMDKPTYTLQMGVPTSIDNKAVVVETAGENKIEGDPVFVETFPAKLENNGYKKFEALIQSAMGGVLFIDEAYKLKNGPIFDTMMLAASNHDQELTIILAGYKDDLEETLFSYNVGLKRRFPQVLMFEDFNESQLHEILQQQMEKSNKKDNEGNVTEKGWYMEPGDADVAVVASRRAARGIGRKGHGNAAVIKKMFESAKMSAMARDDFDKSNLVLRMTDMIGHDPSLRNKIPLLDEALKKLDEYTGLHEVKQAIHELIAATSENYKREMAGQKIHVFALNRLFLGNPGTGKTSIAEIYGMILKALRYLSDGTVEYKSATDFVGAAEGGSKNQTKAIIEKVESSQYGLLEKLTKEILNISLGHPLVSEATVRIDKPNALRFSETVSVEMTLSKNKA